MQTKFKRAASAVLAIIMVMTTLMVGGIMPASADDTVTVKSNGYVFSYEAGGTWTSDLDGFWVSDGSLAICTQLDVNPPGSGGATYKLAKTLGTSYNDGGESIDTKFAYVVFLLLLLDIAVPPAGELPQNGKRDHPEVPLKGRLYKRMIRPYHKAMPYSPRTHPRGLTFNKCQPSWDGLSYLILFLFSAL